MRKYCRPFAAPEVALVACSLATTGLVPAITAAQPFATGSAPTFDPIGHVFQRTSPGARSQGDLIVSFARPNLPPSATVVETWAKRDGSKFVRLEIVAEGIDLTGLVYVRPDGMVSMATAPNGVHIPSQSLEYFVSSQTPYSEVAARKDALFRVRPASLTGRVLASKGLRRAGAAGLIAGTVYYGPGFAKAMMKHIMDDAIAYNHMYQREFGALGGAAALSTDYGIELVPELTLTTKLGWTARGISGPMFLLSGWAAFSRGIVSDLARSKERAHMKWIGEVIAGTEGGTFVVDYDAEGVSIGEVPTYDIHVLESNDVDLGRPRHKVTAVFRRGVGLERAIFWREGRGQDKFLLDGVSHMVPWQGEPSRYRSVAGPKVAIQLEQSYGNSYDVDVTVNRFNLPFGYSMSERTYSSLGSFYDQHGMIKR